MRIAVSLLLLTFLSISTYAQTPHVNHIDVVEYGIYTFNVEKTVQAPGATAGIRQIVNNV